MRSLSLRTQLFLSFLAVIVIVAVFVLGLGMIVIQRVVVGNAQRDVANNLHTARVVYDDEAARIEQAFNLVTNIGNLTELKKNLKLDYLYVVERSGIDKVQSPLVWEAFRGNSNGGTRVISENELRQMNNALFEKASIPIRHTAKAHPSNRAHLTSALTIEYAMPFFDGRGTVEKVLYGGKILNGYFDLIKRIHLAVFENRQYKSKPLGTVTIFQDDVRIATNVLDEKGMPAVGTRVSAEVYDKVVKSGLTWLDRAFVVTDWYLTAYEPIRDMHGAIVGILYVGTLEEPFKDMRRNIMLAFLAIKGVALIISLVIISLMATVISRPLSRLSAATAQLAEGRLDHRVSTHARVKELEHLAEAFNRMAESLDERDEKLRDSNEKLGALNKTYLDLVGTVSHELKGVLGSMTLNAYAVCDGYYGALNPAQLKALTSVARSLDFMATTVRNFLNLSRIERGEFTLNRQPVAIKKDVIDMSIEAFRAQIEERAVRVAVDCADDIVINADPEQLQIVTNNLIGNALKYGKKEGEIRITVAPRETDIAVDVYNDGAPISDENALKLFQRFARLDTPESRKARGTGLGLFITRHIIEAHGGGIRVVPRENGNSFVFEIKKGAV